MGGQFPTPTAICTGVYKHQLVIFNQKTYKTLSGREKDTNNDLIDFPYSTWPDELCRSYKNIEKRMMM